MTYTQQPPEYIMRNEKEKNQIAELYVESA